MIKILIIFLIFILLTGYAKCLETVNVCYKEEPVLINQVIGNTLIPQIYYENVEINCSEKNIDGIMEKCIQYEE